MKSRIVRTPPGWAWGVKWHVRVILKTCLAANIGFAAGSLYSALRWPEARGLCAGLLGIFATLAALFLVALWLLSTFSQKEAQ